MSNVKEIKIGPRTGTWWVNEEGQFTVRLDDDTYTGPTLALLIEKARRCAKPVNVPFLLLEGNEDKGYAFREGIAHGYNSRCRTVMVRIKDKDGKLGPAKQCSRYDSGDSFLPTLTDAEKANIVKLRTMKDRIEKVWTSLTRSEGKNKKTFDLQGAVIQAAGGKEDE